MAGDASGSRSSGGTVIGLARITLWAIIVGGVSCFCLITFMRPTVWYITDQDFVWIRGNMTLAFPGDVPVATATTKKPDGTTAVVQVGRDAPLWSGNTAFPVTLQWGSVMMCMLAVAGLQALSYFTSRGPKPTGVLPQQSAVTSIWRAESSPQERGRRWRRTAAQVRRLGATQLPPYRFRHWWCDGLSVCDAMLVATWLGLATIYLYYNIDRKYKQTGVNLTPPPSPPPFPPPPPPSPIDPSLLLNVTTNGTGGNSTKGGAAAKAPKVVDLMTPLFESLRLEQAAHSFGETMRGLIMVMFIPIARINALSYICGSDFQTIIKYHRWMSWGTILIMFTHGSLYMIQWGASASFEDEFDWGTETGRRNVCGLIACIFGLLIAFTSTTWFRSTYYYVFHRMHLFGACVFLIFGMMHYKNLVNWIMPGLVVFFIDRFGYRLWQMMRNWTRVGPQDAHVDGNMVTLRLSWHAVEGRAITPGQTLYLRCPAVSLLQSHPFSVADVVHTDGGAAHAVVHMMAQGPWTRAVCAKLAQGETLRLQVEGPYTTQLDHYAPSSPYVIMVAGGQGVTPLLGLLRHYLSLVTGGGEAASGVPRVHLVWASRALGPFKLLGRDLLQACCAAASGDKSAWLSASLHYTGFELEEQQSSSSVNLQLSGPKRANSSASDEAHSEEDRHGLPSEDVAARVDVAAPAHGSAAGNEAPLRAHPAVDPLVYALCTLLGFFGAWAGLLAAAYYDAYYARTRPTGANYLSVGILQVTCILFGAALPTLGVLAVNDLFMRRCHPASAAGPAATPERRFSSEDTAEAAKVADKALGGSASGAAAPASPVAALLASTAASLQVLPGYVLAALRGGGAEGGASAPSKALQRGRPDLPVVLARLAQEQQGAAAGDVDVLVAGHDGLVVDVQRACAEHNMRRAAGVPALRCKRVAFHS